MIMGKRARISLMVGCIVLIASVAVCIWMHPALDKVTVLGLGFLLYSEVAFFGGLAALDVWSRKKGRPLRWTGVIVSLGVYAVIVFALSLLFIRIHTMPISSFLMFQIVMFVMMVEACLVLGGVSAVARTWDEKTMVTGHAVQYATDRLELIRERHAEHKAAVDKLIQALRRSDAAITVDADGEISDAITKLQSLVQVMPSPKEEISKVIKKIESLIKKRNQQAQAARQGRK